MHIRGDCSDVSVTQKGIKFDTTHHFVLKG